MNMIQVSGKSVTPTKVLCVGRNYLEHIEELENAVPELMVVFNKPNSSISNTLNAIHQEPLHYEGEICFIVKNQKFYAVGFGLDLTKRGLQSKLKEKGLPWERAKAFDGSAVFSNFELLEEDKTSTTGVVWKDLSVELWINEECIQKGDVSQMLYSPEVILQELSSYTSLEDHDVIMTGTPKGVGVIKAGDIFTGKILKNGQTIVEASWQAK